MVFWKRADLIVQVVLLAGIIIGFLITSESTLPVRLIVFYALSQIISLLAHTDAGKQPWKSKLRRVHIAGLFVIAPLVVLVSYFESQLPNTSGIIIVLLGCAGMLALFYSVITYIEYNKLKQRSVKAAG
jgi:hypothetical protein